MPVDSNYSVLGELSLSALQSQNKTGMNYLKDDFYSKLNSYSIQLSAFSRAAPQPHIQAYARGGIIPVNLGLILRGEVLKGKPDPLKVLECPFAEG